MPHRSRAAPVGEHERSAQELHAYGLLDAPARAELDDLAQLAAAVCGTQGAALSFVDRRRRRLVCTNVVGVAVPLELPIPDAAAEASCPCCQAMTLPAGEVLQVPDAAAADARLRGGLLAGAGIRFFAAVAIHAASGATVGALCVLDPGARPPLDGAAQQHLARLARQVSAALELRSAVAALGVAAAERERLRSARDAAVDALQSFRQYFAEMVEEQGARAPLQRTELERHILLPAIRLLEYMHGGTACGGEVRLLRSTGPAVPSLLVAEAPQVVGTLVRLLQHAVRLCAPGGGAVTLAVTAAAGGADGSPAVLFSIAASGSGDGIPQAELDASLAAQPSEREGGLALCRRSAEALGCTVSAAASQGGATLTLRLPLRLPPGAPPQLLPEHAAQLVCTLTAAGYGSTDGRRPVSARSSKPSAGTGDTPTTAVAAMTLQAEAPPPPPPPPEAASLLPGQRRDGKPLRVLVAEDDRVSRVIMTKLLTHIGAVATLAGDGAAAVATVTAAPDAYDLILLDMEMPILDGPGAASALRAAGITVPMVALTAHSGAAAAEKCLAAGMVGHLAKPVRPETLVTLRAFAEGRQLGPDDTAAMRAWLARAQE